MFTLLDSKIYHKSSVIDMDRKFQNRPMYENLVYNKIVIFKSVGKRISSSVTDLLDDLFDSILGVVRTKSFPHFHYKMKSRH